MTLGIKKRITSKFIQGRTCLCRHRIGSIACHSKIRMDLFTWLIHAQFLSQDP